LQFVRHPTVNGFELSMRSPAAAEVTTLLTGAGRVLQERLDAASDEDAKERLKSLQKARSAAEAAFQAERENLAAWSKANNIDVMLTRYEVEKSALQQLTEESIRATALSVLSGSHLNAIKTLLKDFIDASPSPKLNADKIKGVDAEGVLKLSPEIEQQIDNDQTLKWLDSQRAQWEQERAADLAKTTDGGRKVREIDDRLKTIDQQKREERNRLRWEAAERMLAQAEDDANSRTALLRSADLRKTETNNLVLSIGERVMEYQKRGDELKAKDELLKQVQMEYLKPSANPRSAVAQVEIGALSPPIPETAVVEYSFPYLPIALAFGVGLVLVAAGLRNRNAPGTR
jgi:hypothetical protein